MLSKSTTRQTMTSKSLCHVQNHAFGLVSTERYFCDFHTPDFSEQTSKSPYLMDFFHTHFSTLDINTTVSTWPVHGNMSTGLMALTSYPPEVRTARSRDRVAGSQDT